MNRSTQNLRTQSGFALFIVLILLLILAAASTALIQNQRWAVRQSADRLDVLDQNAGSSIAHERCVAQFREALMQSKLEFIGHEGEDGVLDIKDSKWPSSGTGCVYEWYQVPAQTTPETAWAPHVRIHSRVQVKGVWVQALSEWRYPACGETAQLAGLCRGSATPIKMLDTNDMQRLLTVQFDATQKVLGVRTPVAVQ